MSSSSAATAAEPQGLIPVAVRALRSHSEVDFDLYIGRSKNCPPKLYREKQFPLTAADIDRLLGQGVSTLYAAATVSEQYCEHVRRHVLTDESIPTAERYGIVKDTARTVLLESLQKGDADRVCHVSSGLGQDFVKLICDRRNILDDLFVVMAHDYSTFTHATNVCAYSILLAESFGIRDQSELAKIAQGALLHDIGKSHIPARILNKTQPLTADEKELIRQHPIRGFEDLCSRSDVGWGQLMMIYQHHERVNGSGYPVGLVGSEIHEWGRLCAVVDVFDALTRDRPYRKGAITTDVLEYLDRESVRTFDRELTQCWIDTLQQSRS